MIRLEKKGLNNLPIPYTLNPNQLLSTLKKPFDEYDEGPYFPEDYNLVNNFNISGDATGDGTNTQVVNVNNNVHLLDYYYTGVIDDYDMSNDDDFDVIDNTLNITVDIDDDREDEMEEEENNNKKNNTKLNQSIVGYAKTVNLNIDLNKAFNWYRENNTESSIGKFDLENNEPPEITANGDYTTTDLNNNNYQEISVYTPPTLSKSIEPNNKKSRSLYSNYFRVNVPLPIITDAIINNGYYKFNGNTLISGTDQDYNINVNIPISTSKIKIRYVKAVNNANPDYNEVYQAVTMIGPVAQNTVINHNGSNDLFIINVNNNDHYNLIWIVNRGSGVTDTVYTGGYYFNENVISDNRYGYVELFDENQNPIMRIGDDSGTDSTYFTLSKSLFDIQFN